MEQELYQEALQITDSAIQAVKPDAAVKRALSEMPHSGRIFLVAAGKAAWQMADAAVKTLGQMEDGVVVTKYGHVKAEIPGVRCYEEKRVVNHCGGPQHKHAAQKY